MYNQRVRVKESRSDSNSKASQRNLTKKTLHNGVPKVDHHQDYQYIYPGREHQQLNDA